ncbi:MAG: histidine phosphatase family protein [Chlamydiia bacterium]|nr:histidine phosphatase family protein [Chlamydiia bacterium]
MRHGETAWARDKKHTGLTDIPLTEQGESQAASLGKRLESLSFKHVFSSPLKRAYDTCSICGYNPQVDKDLLEWDYGAYEGLTSAEIHETNPKWNIFTHGAPNGESTEAVVKRATRFLKKVERLEGKIAVFSSGHFSRVFATCWLKLPIENGRRFSLATASLSILGYEHGEGALKLWNDISHLKRGR